MARPKACNAWNGTMAYKQHDEWMNEVIEEEVKCEEGSYFIVFHEVPPKQAC